MNPLDLIEEKTTVGARLLPEEGVRLFSAPPNRVIRMAHRLRLKRFGRRTTWVRNMHLNYSNVCRNRCHFCRYGRSEGEEGAWTHSPEDVFNKVEEGAKGISEIHVVGSIHPTLPFSYYVDLLRGLRERLPGVHLKAYTATEIDHFTRLCGSSPSVILEILKDAGLDSLPGGGAEIFADRIRQKLCPEKTRADRWLEIHEAAHRMGIPSTCTMLYGVGETAKERIDHLVRLRELQDRTGGFTAFVPLAYQPGEGEEERPTSGRLDLTVHAVSRLMLDNIDHLKGYWVMTGVPTAQVLLSSGVDDLDGTIVEERIAHMAGAGSPSGMTEPALRDLILEAGFEPVQRDALFKGLSEV